MGEVYSAHDKRLRRDVALKVLPDVLAQDPERVALFQREAQVIAALNHPNIASIYELEETAELRWLVLELVTGETLEEHLKRGPLAIREALSIAGQICHALEAAHDKGIIHRDLKPANIKITPDGTVKLLDFGLASALELNPKTTELGLSPTLPAPGRIPSHAGTAAYMSPEQFQWKTINKQVDVWAFGCVLFEMVTGKCPFFARTLQDTATSILEAEPDWSLLDFAPRQLLNLMRRCLEKDRAVRLQDIADARIEINYLISAKPGTREPDTDGTEPKLRARWFIAAALLLSTAIVSWALWQRAPEPVLLPA